MFSQSPLSASLASISSLLITTSNVDQVFIIAVEVFLANLVVALSN